MDKVFSLSVLCVVIACVSSRASGQSIAPVPSAAATPMSGAGQIVLQNLTWAKGVTIDTRMGSDPNPENNPSHGQAHLGQGTSIVLMPPPNQDVFWRRDKNPDNPDGKYTDWKRQSASDTSETDVPVD